jgi:methionyl-tRNA formyltransferase
MKSPEFVSALEALRADLGVVAAYGKILTAAVLEAPRLGMLNVHASLLPKYRGAAPVHRAVIDGEAETGVTIMRVVQALDAGPMLASARRPIGPEETTGDVETALADLGASLLAASIDGVASGSAHEEPQDDTLATYAPRLTKEDGVIDWGVPSQRVHDLVRGLYPWPHAFGYLDGRRYILLRTKVAAAETASEPGTIVAATGDLLKVATLDGAVGILEIQPEGKRPMTAREFLGGHRVTVGNRFARHA